MTIHIPVDLHTEYRTDPLGIDVSLPRFGWALEGGQRDAVQSAYRIRVRMGSAQMWDSGKIAGIARADDDIAFQKSIIRPGSGGCCRHARGEYRSVRGTVRSAWWLDGDTFRLEVDLPPNCSAEVHVPARPGAEITHDGARTVRPGIFAVGAGRWSFTVPA